MRRWLIAAAATVLMAGGTGAAVAATQTGPGPNGHNTYGLCNAYGQGSAQGQAQKQAHGAAFVALAAQAAAWDATEDGNTGGDDGTPTAAASESPQQQVSEYCAANGQQP
jgi:hypothetical protein